MPDIHSLGSLPERSRIRCCWCSQLGLFRAPGVSCPLQGGSWGGQCFASALLTSVQQRLLEQGRRFLNANECRARPAGPRPGAQLSCSPHPGRSVPELCHQVRRARCCPPAEPSSLPPLLLQGLWAAGACTELRKATGSGAACQTGL